MSSSLTVVSGKKHWWLSNRKRVERYIKEARILIATHEHSEVASALNLLDAALSHNPHLEIALELKARSLLYLRRFKEVADMLQDYIPSYKTRSEEMVSFSDCSLQQHSRDQVKLLSASDSSAPGSGERDEEEERSFKCFSVSDLKKRVLAGLCKNCKRDGEWRYIVLGQACSYLGLMEDALLLLQTGKRLATATFRRQCIRWSDDNFSGTATTTISSISQEIFAPKPPSTSSESQMIAHLFSHIKFLLRRRAAALAVLDAGAHAEAIRLFSKILDSRRGAPQAFLAECYIHRAGAYYATGRIVEAIADCNRTLVLDPVSISALRMRSTLFELIGSFTDCLHDLEHLKLLYDTVLRDRKLPGPAWKRHLVQYREITGNLGDLNGEIQELKQRVASGEPRNVDYHTLIGLRRGCTRSDLERAHRLLCLRHKPDKAMSFIDRCEFVDYRDMDAVKDQARMSALLLHRLLRKGYSNIMSTIMDEEAAEKQRQRAAAAYVAASAIPAAPKLAALVKTPLKSGVVDAATKVITKERSRPIFEPKIDGDMGDNKVNSGYATGITELSEMAANAAAEAAAVLHGVFCRDMAAVGGFVSQVGFSCPIPVNYEGLSC